VEKSSHAPSGDWRDRRDVTRSAAELSPHDSAWRRREIVHGRPDPALGGRVLRYTGYAEETVAPLRRRHLPSAEITLIVSFDAPLEVVRMPLSGACGASFSAFVAGLHTRPAVTEHPGRQSGIGVGLTSFGALALFRMPVEQLTGMVVDLGQLLGRAGRELEARLAQAPGWQARFALLDRLLAREMSDGPMPAPGVAWALRRLRSTGGRASVAALAREVGWSHRQLLAKFREQVGLAPKSMARVLRLQRSLALLRRPGAPLVDVALAAGFYDQAHMNREFRALAGCTPRQLLAAGLPAEVGIDG
jgi:AraC-like DNA-binding protein